ncbi:MAG: GAF domain-containing sensor histidine kinase [Thermoanaerobaculia bacterium]
MANGLNLRHLKWTAIVAPVVFVAVLEVVVWRLHPELLSWPGRFVMGGVVVVALIFFYGAVFSVIRTMQERLERQNRELLALHRASLDIYGELSLDVILQKVVDQARLLLGARYGAISVVGADGMIRDFVTSGVSPEERSRIGDPPIGKGLLAVPLLEGRSLRLRDLTVDSRAHGFPEHHPPMRSLLAVPILCKGPFKGNLYVSEKESGEEFSGDDETTLGRFATQSAIAIDNAHLHNQLRTLVLAEERARLSREMHDGLAQLLAYVNTKAQAVREYLGRGRVEQATEQLDQLAGAAREVYGDVREGILALRSAANLGRPLVELLEDFVQRWQEQTGVDIAASVDRAAQVDDLTQLQVLRVVQEALTNVRKHSGADEVELSVKRVEHTVRIVVRDHGCGFRPEAPRSDGGRGHFGLEIMRERIESVGGSLRVESEIGEGTVVALEVPARSESPASGGGTR